MVEEIRALTTKSPAELAPEYEQAAKGFAELTGEQMTNSENQSAADKAALIEVPEVAEWLAQIDQIGGVLRDLGMAGR